MALRLTHLNINYLKFLILDVYGCTIDLENVDLVIGKLNKKPNNITEVRNLLGLVGYFRGAIPNFSKIAKSLYDKLKNSDLTSRSNQPTS